MLNDDDDFFFVVNLISVLVDLKWIYICCFGMNRMYWWNLVKCLFLNVYLWFFNNKENVKINVICSYVRVIRRIIVIMGNWIKRVMIC